VFFYGRKKKGGKIEGRGRRKGKKHCAKGNGGNKFPGHFPIRAIKKKKKKKKEKGVLILVFFFCDWEQNVANNKFSFSFLTEK